MKIIFEDNALKISGRIAENIPGNGAILLSFTGVGHAMGGIDVQKPEFFGSGKGFDSILFITDKTRSWGSALDFDLIRSIVLPLADGRPIYAIGNSMGGFLSILASYYLPIGRVMAFAPQYSVDPLHVPWEMRWREYTIGITRHVEQTAATAMVDRTHYYIFSGGRGLDRRHAEMFPAKDNVTHYVFPLIEHNVALYLKEHGLLARTIQACLAGWRHLNFSIPVEQHSPVTRAVTSGE